MPQLPEQIRPIVATIAKYHFWILAALVPLLLVPLLFLGTGRLDKMIAEAAKSGMNRTASFLKVARTAATTEGASVSRPQAVDPKVAG
jgi:hypothetical protein